MGINRALIFSFFLLIVSLSYVQASSLALEFDQVDDKVLVEYVISLDSEQILTFALPDDAISISSEPEYLLEGSVVSIEGRSINLSYITNALLERSDEGYYLVNNIKFNADYDNVTLFLHLEEGSFIDKDRIYPKPDSTITDGTSIALIWELDSVEKGEDLPLFAVIRTPGKGTSPLFWAILILIIAAAYPIFYKLYAKKKRSMPKSTRKRKRRPESKEDIDRYLVESEKTVLSELRKADRGEMWQKELQLKTGFSKAKLSRMVRNLESRNIVEKIPFGNTNKVRLK